MFPVESILNLAQRAEHQRSKCPTCGAARGAPCTTRGGREAERVHYGRPEWSARVGVPRLARVMPAPRTTPSVERRAYLAEAAREVEQRRYPDG